MAGAGMGLMLGQANTDAINRASRYSYGEATGITQTVRNYGASLGFAILGTILISAFRSRITSSLTARGLPGPRGLGAGSQDRPAPGRQRERRIHPAVHPRRLRRRHPRRAVRDGRDHGGGRRGGVARAQPGRPGRHSGCRSGRRRPGARRGARRRSSPSSPQARLIPRATIPVSRRPILMGRYGPQDPIRRMPGSDRGYKARHDRWRWGSTPAGARPAVALRQRDRGDDLGRDRPCLPGRDPWSPGADL